MNISKFIAKLVLVLFVFSSVQTPIFAGSDETEGPIVEVRGQNNQQYQQYNQLRKRRKWKRLFISVSYLALSACTLWVTHDVPDHPKRTELAVGSVFCGTIGAYLMYDFLKARFWGR